MTTPWRRLAWTLVLVTLGSLWLARDAAAYWGVTALDYGGQLTGYARVEKDAWDGDSELECTHWDVHWNFGWMCFEAVETFYSVGLEHELRTPTGALQASGAGSSSWTLQLDLVPHTPTVYGTWTHHGEYFTVWDTYLYVWNEFTWEYDVTYEGQSWHLFGGHSPQVNVPPPSPPPVQVHYVHTDALGSVRLMTDAAGQPVTACNYVPFGQDWQSTGDLDECRFAQTERSPDTGAGSWEDLNYAGARYYHSQTGRFTSPDDPIYIDPLNPQTWNLYAYVMNNPVQWLDPSGHQAGLPRYDETVVVEGDLSPAMLEAIEQGHAFRIEIPSGLLETPTARVPVVGGGQSAPGSTPATTAPGELSRCEDRPSMIAGGGVAGTAGAIALIYGWPFLGLSVFGGYDMLNGQYFVTIQGSATFGLGAFAGAGAQVGGGASSSGLKPGFSWQRIYAVAEANAGSGPSVGGQLAFNGSGVSATGAIKGGVGYGVMAGVGPATSITFATPSITGVCQ